MTRRRPTNPYRMAHVLIGTGSVLGLGATYPLPLYLPVLAATGAFALVLLVALIGLWRPTAIRRMATASVVLALLAGQAIFWFSPALWGSGVGWLGVWALQGIGVVAIVIGGGIARLPETEVATGRVADRIRLGPLLICVGGGLVFLGSRVVFFGLFALLKLFAATLLLGFGALLFQERRESRLLAGAVIYFALVAGGVDLFFDLGRLVWFGLSGDVAWLYRVTALGMATAVAGGIIRLIRVPIPRDGQTPPPGGFDGSGMRGLP